MSTNLDSKNEEAFINIGMALIELKAYEKAIENYEIAIELNASNYTAYLRRGEAYELMGRH